MIDARIPAALGASLLLHGAALALVDRLPRGWQPAAPAWSHWGTGVLLARLRMKESGKEPAVAASPQRAAARSALPREFAGIRDTASSAPGLVAPPRYLPAAELDERPQIRSQVEPVFPPHAGVASGRVVLRLRINETGTVDQATATEADPAGIFDAAAVEAFAPARFTPGRKEGVATKSELVVELRFGAAQPALGQVRQQELPLFQPPRRARTNRSTNAQENR
jgi:TonB family protein